MGLIELTGTGSFSNQIFIQLFNLTLDEGLIYTSDYPVFQEELIEAVFGVSMKFFCQF